VQQVTLSIRKPHARFRIFFVQLAMHNTPAVATRIGPHALPFPPHSAVVECVFEDAGSMGTADKFPLPYLERGAAAYGRHPIY